MPSISAQKRHGQIVGYSVYLGKHGDQRRQRRFFVHRSDAETFAAQHTTTPIPVGELWERKAEILYALERLRPLSTGLTEAVTFYLAQRGSTLGQKMLAELVAEFLTEKRQIGRSHAYDRSMRKRFTRFITLTGGDRKIGDVSRQQIADYVYRTHHHLSNVSKKNLLTNISVLLNFAVRRDYLTANPVEKIDRPTIPFQKPHVLSPADFGKLLRKCQQKQWHDRLVVFLLVGFCGIRVEEASKLKWSNLHLDRCIVEVPSDVAKKASFRNNPIPANAMAWLQSVADKRRTGRIIGAKWRNRLRSAVLAAKINYDQNCIRHSFCSYALAGGHSLADVIACMGHGGSPAMVFSHYRNVVSEEDGKRWFNLVPEN